MGTTPESSPTVSPVSESINVKMPFAATSSCSPSGENVVHADAMPAPMSGLGGLGMPGIGDGVGIGSGVTTVSPLGMMVSRAGTETSRSRSPL
jgi:hypothetical protein